MKKTNSTIAGEFYVSPSSRIIVLHPKRSVMVTSFVGVGINPWEEDEETLDF